MINWVWRRWLPAVVVVAGGASCALAPNAVASSPPIATATAPSSLRGEPFEIDFRTSDGSGPAQVDGVSAQSLWVAPQGSSTPLAGTLTCSLGDAAPGSCDGTVDKAFFTPSRTLIAGQPYAVHVDDFTNLPPGTEPPTPICPPTVDPVRDPEQCVQTQVIAARAPTVLQYNDPGPVYFWGAKFTPAALGGSYVQEQYPGAQLAWVFGAGSPAPRLVFRTGPDRGIARVSILSPGHPAEVERFDTYAPTPGFQEFSFSPSVVLPPTKHTLIVRVTWNRNGASTGNWIGLDALRVGDETIDTPKTTARWSDGPGFGYVFSGQKGAAVMLKFFGSGLTVNSLVGPNGGDMSVRIDGVSATTWHLFGSSFMWQDFSWDSHAAPALHRALIKVVGGPPSRSIGSVRTFTVDG